MQPCAACCSAIADHDHSVHRDQDVLERDLRT